MARSAHASRWITALVALPFLIAIVYWGNTAFTLLVAAAAVVCLGEYFRMVFDPDGGTVSGLLIVVAMVIGTAVILAAAGGRTDLALGSIAVNTLFCGLFTVTQTGRDPVILHNIARQIQGVAYIPLCLAFLVLIRNGADGRVWIFLLLAVIFAGDIGAYYIGSYWGRHRLCPMVSPKKTVEGALGGLAANLLVGAVGKAIFLPALPWGGSLLFFVCAGAVGQAGDFFESAIKRDSGIKDSGTILPGHGGVFDRIDALLFAAPLTYLFKVYILS